MVFSMVGARHPVRAAAPRSNHGAHGVPRPTLRISHPPNLGPERLEIGVLQRHQLRFFLAT
jgi:hypothetical protein